MKNKIRSLFKKLRNRFKKLILIIDNVRAEYYNELFGNVPDNNRVLIKINGDVSETESYMGDEYLTRDYIECPKPNGYQSLHIQMESKNNKDLDYETQIRTL